MDIHSFEFFSGIFFCVLVSLLPMFQQLLVSCKEKRTITLCIITLCIMIYIINDLSTTNAVCQRQLNNACSGSSDVYTDAIRPITCHSWIYCTHHFRTGGQAAIILQGLHCRDQCWPMSSKHDGYFIWRSLDV